MEGKIESKFSTFHPEQMKEEIFISEFSYDHNKTIIIEGDENSIWVYLLDSSNKENTIECDGFLCSRGTIIETVQGPYGMPLGINQ